MSELEGWSSQEAVVGDEWRDVGPSAPDRAVELVFETAFDRTPTNEGVGNEDWKHAGASSGHTADIFSVGTTAPPHRWCWSCIPSVDALGRLDQRSDHGGCSCNARRFRDSLHDGDSADIGAHESERPESIAAKAGTETQRIHK